MLGGTGERGGGGGGGGEFVIVVSGLLWSISTNEELYE